MAIRLPYTVDSTGLSLPDAYVRVTSYHGDKQQVIYSAEIYTDKAARQAGKEPLASNQYRAQLSDLTGAWFPSLYTDIKARPEFAGAVDEP
jgi:hypothetical protein